MREWEMSVRRYAGLALTSAAIVLGGYGIMILVTPTDQSIKAVPPYPPAPPDSSECLLSSGNGLTRRKRLGWNGKRNYLNI